MVHIWDKLDIEFSEPVRDPLWRNILLPASFSEIESSYDFIKLSRILQLGPAHLVYPGASHTRRAHSFGVFEMAKRIISALASRAGADSLIWSISRQEMLSYLVAALCHDLGHFPFTHSLKELPLREHEELTAAIMLGPLFEPVRKAGAEPELAAAIVDEKRTCPKAFAPKVLDFFRSMLSGVLDPDKLDYLNRDAWACGVPYGVQDVDFTLQHLAMDSLDRLSISERGIMSVEAVLFSKYQMYKAVYWHKNVRAATAMIKHALIESMAKGKVMPEELYGLDDNKFYELMTKREEHGLIKAVFSGKLYSLCYETVFDPDNAMHKKAESIENRAEMELLLSESTGFGSLIIDIPEPISFESNLPVLDSNRDFHSFSTAFGPDLVATFARSLRILRIYCDGEPDKKATRNGLITVFREMFGY